MELYLIQEHSKSRFGLEVLARVLTRESDDPEFVRSFRCLDRMLPVKHYFKDRTIRLSRR